MVCGATGRGGNGDRYTIVHVGNASAPQGEASWETDGIGHKNGFPTCALARSKAAVLYRGGSTADQARQATVGVGRSTMYRLKRKFDDEGHCEAGRHGRPAAKYRKLAEPHRHFIVALVTVLPTRTTAELVEDLYEQFHITVSVETVRRQMFEVGLTSKVLAPMEQRAFTVGNQLSAAQWLAIKPTLHANKMVFMDETGKRPCDVERVRGRARSANS